MKRRKVIGYEKTLEYLKKGYELVSYPMHKNDYIIDKETREHITVRYDVLGKMLMNHIQFNSRNENYTRYYSLKETN